jgi:hypothetical protein
MLMLIRRTQMDAQRGTSQGQASLPALSNRHENRVVCRKALQKSLKNCVNQNISKFYFPSRSVLHIRCLKALLHSRDVPNVSAIRASLVRIAPNSAELERGESIPKSG